MPTSFNTEHPPFNLLSDVEVRQLLDSIDLAYFQQDEIILEAGQGTDYLYVILKGAVAETDNRTGEVSTEAELIGHYTNEDLFGAITILNGVSRYTFIALEETICYIIPKAVFLALIESNQAFADFFQKSLKDKARLLAKRRSDDYDVSGFMLAQVDDSCMRDPLVLAAGTSIREATRALRENHADCLLVQSQGCYGIVTKTDLLDAVVLRELSLATDIAEIAHYDLLTLQSGEFLFNALVLMTRHRIERVVVFEGERLVGLVELTDILSYFSNQAHVIGLQIERAETIEELARAAHGLNDLIRSLMSHGVKIRFAMDLLAALNGRTMAKAFDMLVPPEVRANVCLLVMGSEGRAEQILKTDQDNALIIRDGLEWPERDKVLQRFTEVLLEFGYPRCPGNVMVSNPEWVMTESQWRERLSRWTETTAGEEQMNLAIFVDAHAVAGDARLLQRVRKWMFDHLAGNDVFYSYFAAPVLRFSTPLTLFGGLKNSSHGIDIKKGGIFPIVHGVRTMALEHRIQATNTFSRIEALAAQGIMDEEFAGNLIEALELFVLLRLQQQLKRLDSPTLTESPNQIMVSELSRLDRDLLREALHLVKEFKSRLSYRYRLER